MAIHNVNTQEFEDSVLKSETPVLVDFYADWCGPCRALAPKIEEISAKYEGRAKIVKVNVDDNQQLAQQYGIRGIPSLLFFDEGQVANQLQGNQPKENIEQALDALIRPNH